jgi:hypothetical protein
MLAREAFAAAATRALPGAARRGLAPHRAHYLFQSLWRPPPDAPLRSGDRRPGSAVRPVPPPDRHAEPQPAPLAGHGSRGAAGPQSVALRVLAGDVPGRRALALRRSRHDAVQHARTAAPPAAVLRPAERTRACRRTRCARVQSAARSARTRAALISAVRALERVDRAPTPAPSCAAHRGRATTCATRCASPRASSSTSSRHADARAGRNVRSE